MRKRLIILILLMALSVGIWQRPKLVAVSDATYQQLKLLIEVMTLVKDNYVEERDNKTLLIGAINGLVKTLDPFSQFMEPEIYKEMKTETEGQFGGLGIRIAMRDNILTVITPLPGTPAYRAGILPEDKIIKIEDESTEGITMDEALKKLRGQPGTKVNITIARQGSAEPINFTITRDIIKIETIYSKMLENKIAYIRLTEFNANTSNDLDRALKELLDEQKAEALILDMRNNPGGLLNIAVDVCKKFLGHNQMIVYTQGRRPDSRQEYRSGAVAPYGTIPMAVLVNRGSASGSEIVAGALKDNKRAMIIASRTFGKASVQSVFPLSENNALRLTTAHYYTPAGTDIQYNEKKGTGGITPDVIVEVPKDIEIKLYQQSEEIYIPPSVSTATIKTSQAKEKVTDEALQKAIDLLKMRDIIRSLQEG